MFFPCTMIFRPKTMRCNYNNNTNSDLHLSEECVNIEMDNLHTRLNRSISTFIITDTF